MGLSIRLNLWSSKEMLWIVSELRTWMFNYAMKLKPSLAMETTEAYWDNLQRTTRILQARLVSNEESQPPKKKIRQRFFFFFFPFVLIQLQHSSQNCPRITQRSKLQCCRWSDESFSTNWKQECRPLAAVAECYWEGWLNQRTDGELLDSCFRVMLWEHRIFHFLLSQNCRRPSKSRNSR